MLTPTFSVRLVAMTLIMAVSASAQDDSTRLSTLAVQPVVVAATRAAADAPVAQTLIDSAALRQVMVGQDVQYVLERTAPSILAYSESGTGFSNYGTFRLRGIDQTRVNVTFNGAPLNDMIDQGVFFSNITDLTNGVASIQVQRGVGLSQNGTASFAGSVNLESPSLATSAPGGRIQLNAGSFGLLRGSAEVTSGQTEAGVSLYAKVTTFRTDGYRVNTGTSSQSAQVGAAWFGAADVVRLTAVGGRTQNELGYIPVPKPLADADPATNVNDPTDHDDFGQYLLQLDWSHALTSTTSLGVMAYYGSAGGDYFAGFRDEQGALTQINYPLTNRHAGGIFSVDVEDLAPNLDVSAGLHAYRFWRRNWEAVTPELEDPYYDDRTVKDEVSGYVKAEWMAGGLQLFADLQVRHVRLAFSPDARWVPSGTAIPDHTWLFVNPRLGATMHLDAATHVYASVGRTGREPTRFDLLGGTQINEANLEVVSNPGTVQAETATDLELGLRHRHPIWEVDVNGFAMFFRNEIAPIGRYIDQWFVQLRKNVPTSQRYGIEVQAAVRPLQELSLAVNATWMTSNIDTYTPENVGVDTTFRNVQAVLTPNVLVTASLSYTPIKPLAITATVRHSGQQWLELSNDPALVLPSFTVADLSVHWQVVGRTRLGLTVYNLFDAAYAANGAVTVGEGGLVPAVFMQATRNAMVMLEVGL